MVTRYNEGKALDAVLRRIEIREQANRGDDGRSPDDLGDADPRRRVDYVCTIGSKLYAFEHTGIEPFANYIETQVRNDAFFSPVVERFDGQRTDAEFWELAVPLEASSGLTKSTLKRTRDTLIGWIEAKATTFPLVQYGNRFANPFLGETIVDVPFRVSLHRWSCHEFYGGRSPLCGRFAIKYSASGDVESARLTRLQKACNDKFSKLAAWKRDGAASVLVLEENDISLTNHQLVADAMSRAEAGISDAPDEIFLVSTSLPDVWWVTCLRRDGKNYYDDGERFHEFEPSTLRQLTKR